MNTKQYIQITLLNKKKPTHSQILMILKCEYKIKLMTIDDI